MAAAAAVPPVQATALVVIDMSVEQFGCVQYTAGCPGGGIGAGPRLEGAGPQLGSGGGGG